MNKTMNPSLLGLFSPPDGSPLGVFGLMCALSADTSFMESVLENFTGKGALSRRYSRHCALALFLDPEHSQLTGLPGLAWGHPLVETQLASKIKKAKMMHAKVALLGFGKAARGRPDYYRLIVFTGNWTREAVNNSLNLVWLCDYDGTSRHGQDQEAADLFEAAKFWEALLGLGKDDNKHRPGYYRLSEEVHSKATGFCNELLDLIGKPKTPAPRFFSNLQEARIKDPEALKKTIFKRNSIGGQLIQRIPGSEKKPPNFICCGSGFFEQAGAEPKEPEVLSQLVKVLQKKGALTDPPEYKYLIINKATSGAAGYWLKKNKGEITWEIYKPSRPENVDTDNYVEASLHSKFVYIADYNNKKYKSGLLYLGSANLSKQGFANEPGPKGNVEAGVFLKVNEPLSERALCKRLGIYDGEELNSADIPDKIDLKDEQNEAGRHKPPPAPPISSCNWKRETLVLNWVDAADSWRELRLCGLTIAANQKELVLSTRPNFSVELTACTTQGKKKQWWIPVFVEEGDFCFPLRYKKKPDDMLKSLLGFPDVYPEDEDETEETSEPPIGEPPPKPPGPSGNDGPQGDLSNERAALSALPLHLTTSLIETIAQKNQALAPGQMPDWVAHLRRVLLEELDEDTVEKIKSLNIHFLRLLIREPGFAPKEASGQYRKLIRDLEKKWGLKNALPLMNKKE